MSNLVRTSLLMISVLMSFALSALSLADAPVVTDAPVLAVGQTSVGMDRDDRCDPFQICTQCVNLGSGIPGYQYCTWYDCRSNVLQANLYQLCYN